MQHKINDMIHRQYLQKYEYTKMRLTCVLFKNKSLSDKYSMFHHLLLIA